MYRARHGKQVLGPLVIWALGFTCAVAGEAVGEPEGTAAGDLTQLSLEDLMSIEVTSVSKRAEPQRLAPAAVYVLTAEDIRRSGATTVPEVLRTVPGLHVARLNANSWSVSVRGFSGQYANKLLVLVDGRSVYTPLFSGVFWESLDVMLEDIERIEVIRGPGGTLWGANAVNGVINIITKKASETTGGVLTLGGGTEDEIFGRIRYGGPLGDLGFYRFYLGYSNHDEAEFRSGKNANDAWDSTFGGFRIDLTPDDLDTVTIEGRASGNDTSETLDSLTRTFPYSQRIDGSEDLARRSLVARWNRNLANDSRFQLRAYYDYFESDATSILQREHTVDLDFQYEFEAGERHRIVWGTGFRYVSDDIRGTNLLSLDPDERDLKIFSAYLQDEIDVIQDTLSLTLGTKLEHNSYSGLEIQPNARLTWTPADRHTVWLAASRAVRSPSRAELDVRLESITTRRLVVALYGDNDFESEDVFALEAGYRVQLHETAALDLAVFHNQYDDLRTAEFRRPFIEIDPLPVHIANPVVADNNMSGTTYGFEAALDWRPKEWWRVRTGYSYLEMDLSPNPDTIDILSGAVEDESPEQQFFMHHSFELPRNVEIDTTFRYVDTIPALGVDDYLTMDIRLAWLPRENLEFSLVGRNLLEDSHLEYAPSFINTVPTEVERGVYGKVTWRF